MWKKIFPTSINVGYEIVTIVCTHVDYVCVPRDILCESICTGYKQCVGRSEEEVCKSTEMRTKKETQKIHRRPTKYPLLQNNSFLIGLFLLLFYIELINIFIVHFLCEYILYK